MTLTAETPTRALKNNQIEENTFFGNGTADVRLQSGQPAGTMNTNVFFNNSFGSSVAVINNHTLGEVIDFSGNWWGANTTAGVQAKITGLGASDVDFTPFLDSPSDTDGAPGFQGDFSTLHVTALGGQTGATGRIDEAVGLANTNGAVIVHDGTYAELVNVNKSLILTVNPGDTATVTAPGAASNAAVFSVTAPDVTIDGFEIVVNRPNAAVGIAAQSNLGPFDNLQITNNNIHSTGSGSTFATGPTVNAAAIYLKGDGAPIEQVLLQGNTVDMTSGGDYYSRGVFLREVQATIGGASASDGNDITGIGKDLLFQFPSDPSGVGGSGSLIQNNTFRGPLGIDITEPNPGAVNIRDNTFVNGFGPLAGTEALFLNHVVNPSATVSIFDNSFSDYETGVHFYNQSSASVTSNTFTGAMGPITDADVLVEGTSGPETISVTPTGVSYASASAVIDGTVGSLKVLGLAGDDIFNVDPSLNTEYFLFGGDPAAPASPGDTLNYFTPAGESASFKLHGSGLRRFLRHRRVSRRQF